MGNYEELKAAIQQVITTNGNNEITGALLQQTLLSIVNSVGANAAFAGIATPNTNPGTADQNVFYLAGEAGIYVNFGGIKVAEGEAVILSNKTGTWVKSLSGFATKEGLDSLERQIGDVNMNLIGEFNKTIPGTQNGWHYYPIIPKFKKDYIYNIVVTLSSSSDFPFYWRFTSNGTVIIRENVIVSGNLQGTSIYNISENYNDVVLEIYSGGNIPEFNISISTNDSDFEQLNKDIESISLNVEQNRENIEMLLKECDNMIMATSRYFYTEGMYGEKTTYPQVLNGQYPGIVNGIKISIAKAGTLTIVKVGGFNTNTPTFTELQSFNVVNGVNYLVFNSPVVLGENEAIGISPQSTAEYHRAARGSQDIGSKYFNGTIWLELVNGVVMAIYSFDLSNILKRLNDAETIIDNNSFLLNMFGAGNHYVTALGSARFGKVTASEKPTSPVFVDGQERLIGKTIVGLKVDVAKAGVMVICKCANYRLSNPTFTELQSFDVIKGENFLLLNTPVVLGENEAIGISPQSTAEYHRGGYDSDYNKGYYYYNNAWNRSGADLVVAILTNDVGVEDEDIKTSLVKIQGLTSSSTVYPTTPPTIYGHLFIDKIYLDSSPTIPCQSLFDVYVTARLGFKMMEINVTITSDGIPVTGHVVDGKLESLTNLNGDSVAVDVSQITFAELRANYRYKSTYPQFRTPITSLEECLRACQQYNITPFVQCVNNSIIRITENIVGMRYVAYGGLRLETEATLCEFHSNTTAEQIVNRCKTIGFPFIIGVAPEMLDAMSDEEVFNLISQVHAEKCWINWAGCYHSPSSNLRMRRLGLDSCASGWEVPYFTEYDIRKQADIIRGFNDFNGNFSLVDDGVNLTNQQTIFVEIPQVSIIAKSQLSICFAGTLNVRFGSIDAEFTSDGKEVILLNSIVENKTASLNIVAIDTTSIYNIDYIVASVI